MRPGDAARFLSKDENAELTDIDLRAVPGKRADAYAIHVRASLQEAFDLINRTEADALVVERTTHSNRAITYGVLTREAIDASYRP